MGVTKVSDSMTFNLPFNLSENFRVAVVWYQNHLAVRVTGGGSERYHYL